MPETVMLPHHARRAMLRADSFNPDDNSIEVVWTTGASVLRYDWDGPYQEVLEVTAAAVRLDRLNAGAPFLNTHSSSDLSDVLGRVTAGTAKVQGGEGVCRVALSTDPAKAGLVGDIRGGIICNVSVGYIIHEVIRTEGKDGAAATCRVTDWEPIEISAVPIPADPGAQVRSEPTGTKYPCVVKRELPAGVPAAAETETTADPADARTAPAAITPPADPTLEARATETARVQGIIRVARQLNLPEDLADTAIADGSTLDAFRTLAIDARGSRPAAETAGRSADASTPVPPPNAASAATQGEAAMPANEQHNAADTAVLEARANAAVQAAAVDANAVRAAERQRIGDIRVAARKLGLPDSVADTAIDGGMSIDGFRAQAIDLAAAGQNDGQVTLSVPASDSPAHRTFAQPAEKLPKGTHAGRAMLALAATRGNRRDAADYIAKNYGTSGEPVSRALTTSVGSAGGFLVPEDMSTEVIELLRPASVVMAMGPNVIPMPNGNFSMSPPDRRCPRDVCRRDRRHPGVAADLRQDAAAGPEARGPRPPCRTT